MSRQKEGGYSLVGVAMGIAISSLLLVSVCSIVGWAAETQGNAVSRLQVDLFRRDMVTLVNSDPAWAVTVTGPINSQALACLRLQKPCTLDGTPNGAPLTNQAFALYNLDGTLFYDGTQESSGLGPQGARCQSYTPSNAGSCPYHFDLSWSARCKPGNCVNPQILVSAVFYYTQSNSRSIINPSDYTTIFYRQPAPVVQTPPTNLSLTQTSNSRNFTVSWSAGSGNGGAGGCKLQYWMNGTTWTDLAGTYDCDSDTVNAAELFPTTDFWTNNFNAIGVSVQLVRISDSTVMGVFPQNGTCLAKAGSPIPTPDIDEDCNGQWDNTTSFQQDCVATWPLFNALTPGTPYTCPPTMQGPPACTAPVPFSYVAWNILGTAWDASNNCTGGSPIVNQYMGNISSVTPTGIVPTVFADWANHNTPTVITGGNINDAGCQVSPTGTQSYQLTLVGQYAGAACAYIGNPVNTNTYY